ncbi:hypothetical protein EV188_103446 [Actinomycetospora succinea]|uniref:Uncharacterized protein n=1 Tax=Actinomycetospora succinea TaxID=663603 RepID=A0A4R6VDW5_9PSEU|nr:hypothetical protein EV188_103446 [Actinomycetospora succinea]
MSNRIAPLLDQTAVLVWHAAEWHRHHSPASPSNHARNESTNVGDPTGSIEPVPVRADDGSGDRQTTSRRMCA